MTDFYTILRDAIGEAGSQDTDARQVLYARARSALEAQIDALAVPLSGEQRAAQLAQLDDAVRRLEEDYAGSDSAGGEAGNGAGAADAESREADAEAAQSPVAAAGVKPAEAAGGAQAGMADVKPAEAARAPGADAVARPAHTTRHIAPPRRETPSGRGGGRRVAVIVLAAVLLGAAGAAAWLWRDVQPVLTATVDAARTKLGLGGAPADRVAGAEEGAPSAEPAPGKRIMFPVGESRDGASGEAAPAKPSDMAAADAPRTPETAAPEGGNAAPAPAAPAAEAGTPASAPAAPQASATQAETQGQTHADAAQPAAAAAPEPAAQPQDASQGEDAKSEERLAAKDQDRIAPAGPAAERAYMIVEQSGSGSDDRRYAGSTRWSLTGSGAAMVLSAEIRIPERSAVIVFTMRRNNDASLPASHMVDINYQASEDEDGPIINVPGFMVRVEDSETPVPVRSAGALIMPGQYLLGLSGGEEDRAHNLTLLKTAQWLEIPAMFKSRRRLVMVVEMGRSGTAAMQAALAAWSAAGTATAPQEKAGQ